MSKRAWQFVGSGIGVGRSLRVALVLSALACACAGKSSQHDDSAGAGSAGANQTDGGAPSGGTTPAGGGGATAGASGGAVAGAACVVNLDGVDVTVTPRADTNLERMALKFSSQFVADQAIYDRFVRDVGAIRIADPSIADIQYFAQDDGQALLLSVDSDTLHAMQAGEYHDWDCLNQALGLVQTSFDEFASSSSALLTLKGIYDLQKLGPKYDALPGVKGSGPNSGGGDGSTLCVTQQGDTWHYVFDRASGDCLAGCIEHSYTHFATDAAGAVTSLGTLSAADRAVYASAEACR